MQHKDSVFSSQIAKDLWHAGTIFLRQAMNEFLIYLGLKEHVKWPPRFPKRQYFQSFLLVLCNTLRLGGSALWWRTQRVQLRWDSIRHRLQALFRRAMMNSFPAVTSHCADGDQQLTTQPRAWGMNKIFPLMMIVLLFKSLIWDRKRDYFHFKLSASFSADITANLCLLAAARGRACVLNMR